MKSPIYVFGHKNPDTDSICSTLAYAELKRKLGVENVVPCRLGKINNETKFVLEYFGVDEPLLIENIGMKLRDLEMHNPVRITAEDPLKKAWDALKTKDASSRLLPVLGDDVKLQGILSIADITRIFMEPYDEEMVHRFEIRFNNLMDILQGKILTGSYNYELLCGSLFIGAPTEGGSVSDKDVVITNKVETARHYANERGVGCVVLTNNYQPLELEKAKSAVVCVPHSILKTIGMLNQAISCGSVMNTSRFEMFSTETKVDEAIEIMKTSSHRNFPVVDRTGRLFGVVSRRHILDYERKRVILVDHNEANQSVDGLSQAEIVEIIDHHRVANIETQKPLYIRSEPVGCSATIIYGLYKEHSQEPDAKHAGLMLSAILSDTLMFSSPTTTNKDELAALDLAKLAGVEIKDYGQQMFLAGTKLSDYSPEEIFSMDRKQFSIGEYLVHIAQVNTLDIETALMRKAELVGVMHDFTLRSGSDLALLMITDILSGGSELLVAGKAKELIVNAYGMEHDDDHIYLQDVVSRKAQVVPRLTQAAQSMV